MAISSAQNSRYKSFFLRKLTGFVPQLWIFDHTLSCLLCSSLHLSLIQSSKVPLGSTAAPLEFFHSLSLYAFCPRHNSRRRSLFMRVLSHSDTHPLNRYMAQCGCHEILIPRSFYVRFLTRFCHFRWTSYSSLHLCLSSWIFHYACCISVHLSVQDTTPEGVLSSCGCSPTLTLTTSIGTW